MRTTLLLLAGVLQDTSQTEGRVAWIKDYDKAIAAAADSGKPIFLFFGCC
jgi:hypothetical protein